MKSQNTGDNSVERSIRVLFNEVKMIHNFHELNMFFVEKLMRNFGDSWPILEKSSGLSRLSELHMGSYWSQQPSHAVYLELRSMQENQISTLNKKCVDIYALTYGHTNNFLAAGELKFLKAIDSESESTKLYLVCALPINN